MPAMAWALLFPAGLWGLWELLREGPVSAPVNPGSEDSAS